MSDLILYKVQNYLANLAKIEQGNIANSGFSNSGRFSETVARAFKRQLLPEAITREFTIRMSTIGRPGCQLQAEQAGFPRGPEPYSSRFRNLYGDIIEAAAVSTMKLAGVNIVSEQETCELKIGGITIKGTYDLEIAEPEPKLYDVKSASGYLFKNKYLNRNLQNVYDDGDVFGQVTQVYLYSTAKKIPVGGLIVINKEDGQWTLVPPPQDDSKLRLTALRHVESNIIRLVSKQPFTKDFEPQKEKFRKKETGNLVLPSTCSFCPYIGHCWPEAKLMKNLASKGESPKTFWYTHIDDKYKEEKEEDNG